MSLYIDCNYRCYDFYYLIFLLMSFIESHLSNKPKSVYTKLLFFFVVTPTYICSMRFVYFWIFVKKIGGGKTETFNTSSNNRNNYSKNRKNRSSHVNQGGVGKFVPVASHHNTDNTDNTPLPSQSASRSTKTSRMSDTELYGLVGSPWYV